MNGILCTLLFVLFFSHVPECFAIQNCCDLIISPDDLEMNRYPTMPVSGGSGEPEFQVTIRNAGAVASGAFSIGLQIVYEGQTWTTGVSCDGLLPGEKETLQFTWSDPPSGVSGEVHLAAIADPQENTPDSWRPNNSAEADVTVRDFYPNQEGWPVRTYGSIKTPQSLADFSARVSPLVLGHSYYGYN